MNSNPLARNEEAPGAATPRASMSERSRKGTDAMDTSNPRQKCNFAAFPGSPRLSRQQTAVITIGRLLVAYRINGRSEQRAELHGMARMALALGAIDAATHTHLLDLLSPVYIPEIPKPYPPHRATARRSAGQEVH